MSTRKVENAVRLKIDGDWKAEELVALLRSLEDIYNLTAILGSRRVSANDLREQLFNIDRRVVRKIALQVSAVPPLSISQIKYASPGFADLFGTGKAIKHMKDFVLAVTDRVLESKQRNFENDARHLANEKAISDQKFLEREREALLEQNKQNHQLAVITKRLENLKLAEEVQTATLSNLEKEVTVFSASLTRMMQQKELPGEVQSGIIHWVGTRMHPVSELAEASKLVGIEELPPKVEK